MADQDDNDIMRDQSDEQQDDTLINREDYLESDNQEDDTI
jgi:hypothetical protein